MAPYMQDKLRSAIDNALAGVAADGRKGISEIVGLDSEWWTDNQNVASVVVYLPEDVDAEYVARAVNLENLEAWLDDEKRFHIAKSPFYTMKDIDQTVLCVVKVVCQFTGLIGIDSNSFNHDHA